MTNAELKQCESSDDTCKKGIVRNIHIGKDIDL